MEGFLNVFFGTRTLLQAQDVIVVLLVEYSLYISDLSSSLTHERVSHPPLCSLVALEVVLSEYF